MKRYVIRDNNARKWSNTSLIGNVSKRVRAPKYRLVDTVDDSVVKLGDSYTALSLVADEMNRACV